MIFLVILFLTLYIEFKKKKFKKIKKHKYDYLETRFDFLGSHQSRVINLKYVILNINYKIFIKIILKPNILTEISLNI